MLDTAPRSRHPLAPLPGVAAYEGEIVRMSNTSLHGSLIKTNDSVQSTNRWMRILTLILALTAIGSVFTEIYTYKQSTKQEQQLQMKQQLLDSTLKSQIAKDSLFQRQVKDSLKMP